MKEVFKSNSFATSAKFKRAQKAQDDLMARLANTHKTPQISVPYDSKSKPADDSEYLSMLAESTKELENIVQYEMDCLNFHHLSFSRTGYSLNILDYCTFSVFTSDSLAGRRFPILFDAYDALIRREWPPDPSKHKQKYKPDLKPFFELHMSGSMWDPYNVYFAEYCPEFMKFTSAKIATEQSLSNFNKHMISALYQLSPRDVLRGLLNITDYRSIFSCSNKIDGRRIKPFTIDDIERDPFNYADFSNTVVNAMLDVSNAQVLMIEAYAKMLING